jgi:hypothetical protein
MCGDEIWKVGIVPVDAMSFIGWRSAGRMMWMIVRCVLCWLCWL